MPTRLPERIPGPPAAKALPKAVPGPPPGLPDGNASPVAATSQLSKAAPKSPPPGATRRSKSGSNKMSRPPSQAPGDKVEASQPVAKEEEEQKSSVGKEEKEEEEKSCQPAAKEEEEGQSSQPVVKEEEKSSQPVAKKEEGAPIAATSQPAASAPQGPPEPAAPDWGAPGAPMAEEQAEASDSEDERQQVEEAMEILEDLMFWLQRKDSAGEKRFQGRGQKSDGRVEALIRARQLLQNVEAGMDCTCPRKRGGPESATAATSQNLPRVPQACDFMQEMGHASFDEIVDGQTLVVHCCYKSITRMRRGREPKLDDRTHSLPTLKNRGRFEIEKKNKSLIK